MSVVVKPNGKKYLAFWGGGAVGRACLDNYPDTKPDYIIDSFAKEIPENNIQVIHPDSIDKWEDFYIVITIVDKAEVKRYLEKKGLKDNEDFIDFELFFEIPFSDPKGTIDNIKQLLDSGKISYGMNLIHMPFYISPRMTHARKFFKDYISEHDKEKFILLHTTFYSFDDKLKQEFNCESIPFRVPDTESVNDSFWADKIHALTEDELSFIEEVESIKASDDPLISTKLKYVYFKEFFSVLKPASIIWWGETSRETFLIKEIANKSDVRFAAAEHGCISGTILIDKAGFEGQKYLFEQVKRDCYKDIDIHRGMDSWERIKVELRRRELSTKIDLFELSRISSLNKHNKTVLFMGWDELGNDINPNSRFWGMVVSSCYSSEKEALNACAMLCEKNKWNLVYKPHPMESETKLRSIEETFSSIVCVRKLPIEILILLADVCVSICSTVEISALLFEKPLIKLGGTLFLERDCVYMVDKADQFEEQLYSAIRNGFTQEKSYIFDRHMAYMLSSMLWDDCMDQSREYGRSIREEIF